METLSEKAISIMKCSAWKSVKPDDQQSEPSKWDVKVKVSSDDSQCFCFSFVVALSLPVVMLADQSSHDPCYSPLLTSPSILHLRDSCRAKLPSERLTATFKKSMACIRFYGMFGISAYLLCMQCLKGRRLFVGLLLLSWWLLIMLEQRIRRKSIGDVTFKRHDLSS